MPKREFGLPFGAPKTPSSYAWLDSMILTDPAVVEAQLQLRPAVITKPAAAGSAPTPSASTPTVSNVDARSQATELEPTAAAPNLRSAASAAPVSVAVSTDPVSAAREQRPVHVSWWRLREQKRQRLASANSALTSSSAGAKITSPSTSLESHMQNAARRVSLRAAHLRARRISEHRRLHRESFEYLLDDDGIHFEAVPVLRPALPRQEHAVARLPAALLAATSQTRQQRPTMNKDKGVRSARSFNWKPYTASPRKPGTPRPRKRVDGDWVQMVLAPNHVPAPSQDQMDRQARRDRVRAQHIATFPTVPVCATTTATAEPPSRHFFADWNVSGFPNTVRISLDSGSDLNTCNVSELPSSVVSRIQPMPLNLVAESFDGTRADMVNFLGTVPLTITLGSFSTTVMFYVVHRGMAPFVVSKFVQNEMEAVFCYKTWTIRPGAHVRPLSKECFDVKLAQDVVISGEMVVRSVVLIPENLLRQKDGSVANSIGVFISGLEFDGVASTSQSSPTATTVDCRPGLSADCVAFAHVIPGADIQTRNAGSGRKQRLVPCTIPTRLLCNVGSISLIAGQVVATAMEYRSDVTRTQLEHPTLNALSSVGSAPPVDTPLVVSSLDHPGEDSVWYDDDPVPTELATARIEAKIAETLSDTDAGCLGLAEFAPQIRECLARMHLGPDEDGRIGAAALGVEHEVVGLEGVRGVQRRNYQYSHEEILFIDETLTKLLSQGVIERAATPWASPIVVATHPRTGKLRFCLTRPCFELQKYTATRVS